MYRVSKCLSPSQCFDNPYNRNTTDGYFFYTSINLYFKCHSYNDSYNILLGNVN